jgi:hypothetical protein
MRKRWIAKSSVIPNKRTLADSRKSQKLTQVYEELIKTPFPIMKVLNLPAMSGTKQSDNMNSSQ